MERPTGPLCDGRSRGSETLATPHASGSSARAGPPAGRRGGCAPAGRTRRRLLCWSEPPAELRARSGQEHRRRRVSALPVVAPRRRAETRLAGEFDAENNSMSISGIGESARSSRCGDAAAGQAARAVPERTGDRGGGCGGRVLVAPFPGFLLEARRGCRPPQRTHLRAHRLGPRPAPTGRPARWSVWTHRFRGECPRPQRVVWDRARHPSDARHDGAFGRTAP
ncbi:hypothetical protein SAMN05216388_10559 [Halorientalis persicus]|uniref:Uncharacterized protein n=1 Tax=Halorientalis persicus TaxID=1367881 RepID=A0A1H8WCT4_9EURY|nr:hypothetical protein SAMN05216388_10559 [Halorientalis persicus]